MLQEKFECTLPAIKCSVRQESRPPQLYILYAINRHVRNVYVPGTCKTCIIYLIFTWMFVGFQYVVGLKKPFNVKTHPSVFAWNSVISRHRCLRCNISSDEHWNGGIFILTLNSPCLSLVCRFLIFQRLSIFSLTSVFSYLMFRLII